MAATDKGSAYVLDLSFKNFGLTDIDAGLAVLADAANPPVGDFAGGIVLPSAGGGVVGTIGVTVEKIPAGKTGRVRVCGVSVCKSNGAITFGTPVQISDTALKLGWVKTCAAATVQIGIAQDTSADGENVRVLHMIANNA